MATHIPTPKTFSFEVLKTFKTTRHYAPIIPTNHGILSQPINISKDQGFAKSSPDYWLKIRNKNKWSDNVTGLFHTGKSMFYYGDLNNKKDTLLFRFHSNGNLTIYLFKDYFTKDINLILRTIQNKKETA